MVGAVNKNGIYYAFDRTRVGAGPVWRARIAEGGPDPEQAQGSVSPSAWDTHAVYVAGGRTVIAGRVCLGNVRALNPSSGSFEWQYCARSGPVIGAVTAIPGLVVAGAGKSLLVLAASSGHVLFTYHMPGKAFLYGAASIADGVLYIGDTGWDLHSFDL
jgi:outer membrane protein assembly factor BamB